MKGKMIPIAVLILLFALIGMGGGVMVWLSIAANGDLTSTQETLLSTADWLVKASAGALLGFAGGSRFANGKSSCRPN